MAGNGESVNIFIDIETIPAQAPWVRAELAAAVKAPGTFKKPESIAQWLAENRESEADEAWLKTSFDGALGQIVCIGWAVGDAEPTSLQVRDLGSAEEAAMLAAWFDALRNVSEGTSGTRPVLIGHNHVAFDIPFVWKRAMVHSIKPPIWFPRNVKPWAESVVDTMTLWDSTQRAGGSMDRLCKVLGIEGKGDFSGADVWPAIQRGEFGRVASYCRDDVRRTRVMFERMTLAATKAPAELAPTF